MSFQKFSALGVLLTLLGLVPTAAQAKVRVVATTDNLAWVTRQIGGDLVSVEFFARGDQDPHMIDARPSQVAKLARADMLVRVGMDLELWLEPLIDAARNPKISRNSRGYVDAHIGLRALEVPAGKLDPSMGDIHIQGNPHYEFSPEVMRTVIARNITEGLVRVDPAHESTFRSNYTALSGRIQAAEKGWRAKLAPFRGRSVVTYHKTFPYLLAYFGLKEFDNVEPKPGIKPSARQVAQVASAMKRNGVKVIITESYRSRQYSNLLARQSGGVVVAIPGGIGGERGIDSYFALMDAIVNRLAATLA
jgi:zinc/manganese transport system substrate-binding protein